MHQTAGEDLLTGRYTAMPFHICAETTSVGSRVFMLLQTACHMTVVQSLQIQKQPLRSNSMGFQYPCSLTFQSSLDSPLSLKPFNIVQGSCSLSESTPVLARMALDIQMSLQSSAYVLENDDKLSRGLFFAILVLRNLSCVV